MSYNTGHNFKLIVDGVEHPVHSVEWSHGPLGMSFSAKGFQPRPKPDACDPYVKRWHDLIDFAKTGAPPVEPYGLTSTPPALEAEGNTSDHAWVDGSPTYSAVLAARETERRMREAFPLMEVRPTELYERAVPRLSDQKPWAPGDRLVLTAEEANMRGTTQAMAEADEVWFEGKCIKRRGPLVGSRPESLNDFATECHRDNQHWWHDPATGEKQDRNVGELLMLVVSEIAECMEGERKDLMDDHLPHRKMAEVELADAVIRIADIMGSIIAGCHFNITPLTVEWKLPGDPTPANKGQALLRISRKVANVATNHSPRTKLNQLAYALAHIEQYATKHGYDLWGAVAEKREYNKNRADHKPAARLAVNGKKF